ncbi:hypothetical protein L6452_00963 [Arctium lappa]|uniref:Uncharacterized protein n=1 Tax=Arctium lappa TaxID=4217 RepID=A0ACB9FFG5_ARCLA|nr:hypothetical protein L6452_00963 [Arctium lappa]
MNGLPIDFAYDFASMKSLFLKKKVEVTYVSEDEFVLDDIDGDLEDSDAGGGELDRETMREMVNWELKMNLIGILNGNPNLKMI